MNDGVAKSPTSGVAAVFQDLDIHMYAFALEKPLCLGDRNFCLAIFLFWISRAGIKFWLLLICRDEIYA